jgi:hypothetical protein
MDLENPGLFVVGKNVLVFLVSGYHPAAYVGRVKRLLGFGAELEDAVMVRWCPNAQWGALAEGDEAQRAATTNYVHAGQVRFISCSRAMDWNGEIPVAPAAA